MSLRLIFMGTPDFAVPTLIDIVGRGHDVVAVYTRAPRPAGRGVELTQVRSSRRGAAFGSTCSPRRRCERRKRRRFFAATTLTRQSSSYR